jgi:hypothetical protein
MCIRQVLRKNNSFYGYEFSLLYTRDAPHDKSIFHETILWMRSTWRCTCMFFILLKKIRMYQHSIYYSFCFALYLPLKSVMFVFGKKIQNKPWICRWKINQTLNYESSKLALQTLQSQSILNLGFVSTGICWCGKSNLKIWWHGKSNQGVISFSFFEHHIFFSSFFSLTFLRGTGHDGRSHGHTASEDCRRRSGRPHRKNHWEGSRA